MSLNTNNELFDFIEKSPCSFFTVNNITKTLKEQGFTELQECSDWSVEPGGKYFVTRNLSSLIAFCIPHKDFNGFMMTASHSESPGFKVKPNPEIIADGYIKLNTEKYGGMIMQSWMDRPLSLAGKIVYKSENGIQTKLVNIDKDLLTIPNLAIHLGKIETPNPQTDMLPILGEGSETDVFINLISENANVKKEDILGWEFFVYSRDKGRLIGKNSEYILAPRIDDLQCVFGTLKGFLQSENSNSARVYCVFDNEEVGSATKQGASSTFLRDVLTRICESMGHNTSDYIKKLHSSFMVSADNGHVIHPNHPEKNDPVNKPKMNGGILIKHNANQKYTTDSISWAIFKSICHEAGVPYQDFAIKSDIPGGSTLGNISTGKVSVNTVDIGMGQLAMHSACETAGAYDTDYLIRAIKTYYEKSIVALSDGCYEVK